MRYMNYFIKDYIMIKKKMMIIKKNMSKKVFMKT
jgi:hypothetical protein